jgi:hypothetical protein
MGEGVSPTTANPTLLAQAAAPPAAAQKPTPKAKAAMEGPPVTYAAPVQKDNKSAGPATSPGNPETFPASDLDLVSTRFSLPPAPPETALRSASTLEDSATDRVAAFQVALRQGRVLANDHAPDYVKQGTAKHIGDLQKEARSAADAYLKEQKTLPMDKGYDPRRIAVAESLVRQAKGDATGNAEFAQSEALNAQVRFSLAILELNAGCHNEKHVADAAKTEVVSAAAHRKDARAEYVRAAKAALEDAIANRRGDAEVDVCLDMVLDSERQFLAP